jgi:hypothetical protein
MQKFPYVSPVPCKNVFYTSVNPEFLHKRKKKNDNANHVGHRKYKNSIYGKISKKK